MAASLDVSNGISDGIKILGELQADNLITNSEMKDYLGYFGDITDLNGTFRTSVRTIHNSGQTGKAAYLNAAIVFTDAAGKAETLRALYISNPKATAKAETVLKSVHLALTGIQTAINKAKG